uniref:Breast carcinoma-amplified sequence 3 n=1 Tax=Ceratitis capitata TaxID=7213 RepID=W8C3F3_CERCA
MYFVLHQQKHVKEYSPTTVTPASGVIGDESIIAHFVAHSEAIVAMEFDNSGMLLLTADRRGHDFHVFRVQPHPVSPSLSAVHHLYVLHRGDTSAKVQNITFSLDSRWVAISTLRGTTHVFPITPYGGPMGVRTHTSLHVVNKLSRFHRSAGLSAEGRSNSPISHSDSTSFMQSLQPYHNTTLPPFPRPTVVLPLAQLRQPFALGSPPGSAGLVMPSKIGVNTNTPNATQRQRHSSLSDDNGKPLSVCAIFAKSRSWLLEPPNITREASHRVQRKSVDSLFVMAGHGALIQYDLDTKLASNIAKDKICDDTPIELEVEAKAQWNLGRRRDGSHELAPPLEKDNWLLRDRNSCLLDSLRQYDDLEEKSESWVSQVEIITHAGPHRRLWMGPQCVFKTYNTPSGSNLNHVDVEAVEIGVSKPASAASTPRSHPLSMPVTAAARCALPVLIESGSYSSIEQSPKLMDRFRHEHLDSDFAMAHGDSRLKEDLADAMRESPSVSEAQKITCSGLTAIRKEISEAIERNKSTCAKNRDSSGSERELQLQKQIKNSCEAKGNEHLLDTSKPLNYTLINADPSRNTLDTNYFHGKGGEQNTIINIDIFDDQISVRSLQSSSSLDLNGILDNNLMGFPASGETVDEENASVFGEIDCGSSLYDGNDRVETNSDNSL